MKKRVEFHREESTCVVVEGETEEEIIEAAEAELDNMHMHFTDYSDWEVYVMDASDDASCYTTVRDGKFVDETRRKSE